jgi:hypothetical protein
MVITRVAPLSCAKVAGVLYLIMGFVFGAFVSLAGMLGGMATGVERGGFFGAVFGMGAIIVLPLLYACLGFVMTLVLTWLFNVVVGITGGIEVDVR